MIKLISLISQFFAFFLESHIKLCVKIYIFSNIPKTVSIFATPLVVPPTLRSFLSHIHFVHSQATLITLLCSDTLHLVWSFLPHSLSLIFATAPATHFLGRKYTRGEFLKQFYQFWSRFEYKFILTF